MSKAKAKEDIDVSQLRAGPGWIIIEPVTDKGETVTDGGIVVPQNFDLNASLAESAVVVSCGSYIATGRTGRLSAGAEVREEGWIPKGSTIQYIPHSPWTLRGTKRPYLIIKCEDVVAYPDPAEKCKEMFGEAL